MIYVKERTIEDITAINDKWVKETNADPKLLKNYFNCIYNPILKANDCGHSKVINVAPPPPLHICKLGPFNHLIKNLSKLCPDHVEKFTETIHVSKEKYHNEDYEGNEINKFLKNLISSQKFLIKSIIGLLMDSGQ